MIGTGFTPEGLTDSYITTELMSEISFRTKPVNVSEWIKEYLKRRYGEHNAYAFQAWQILSKNVLNSKVHHFNHKVLLTKFPTLKLKDYLWYNVSDIAQALDHMILAIPALKSEPGFQ